VVRKQGIQTMNFNRTFATTALAVILVSTAMSAADAQRNAPGRAGTNPGYAGVEPDEIDVLNRARNRGATPELDVDNDGDGATAGLILPAVQSVREAASAAPEGGDDGEGIMPHYTTLDDLGHRTRSSNPDRH